MTATASNLTGGTLDLTDSGMIKRSDSEGDVEMLEGIQRALRSGLDGPHGDWTGTGITSSVAATDGDSAIVISTLLNQIGAADGWAGDAIYQAFRGEGVSKNDILLRYTYFGDPINGRGL